MARGGSVDLREVSRTWSRLTQCDPCKAGAGSGPTRPAGLFPQFPADEFSPANPTGQPTFSRPRPTYVPMTLGSLHVIDLLVLAAYLVIVIYFGHRARKAATDG